MRPCELYEGAGELLLEIPRADVGKRVRASSAARGCQGRGRNPRSRRSNTRQGGRGFIDSGENAQCLLRKGVGRGVRESRARGLTEGASSAPINTD